MNRSAEIRWFFKGIISNDILQFFKENNIVFVEESPRTDWYLSLDHKFTSVKLRNGNIEIKKFLGNIENFQINSEIRGKAEKWIKYSLGLKNNDDSMEITKGISSEWIKVDKRRSILKFEISKGNQIHSISENIRPFESFNVEICTITALNQDWWTIGLEASGSEFTLDKNLEIGTKQIFKHALKLSVFNYENSYGYPEFLSKISQFKPA